MSKQYIDLLGVDFTEWMTTPEQIKLFERMCELQEFCKRPLPECYKQVVESLNIESQIKGLPKRASLFDHEALKTIIRKVEARGYQLVVELVSEDNEAEVRFTEEVL